MNKKIIAFDLDDTLVTSKSNISDHMGILLVKLLDNFDVCIISGGAFEQFKTQVIDRLEMSPQAASRLHLMPTCGTQYYLYDKLSDDWKLQYSNSLTDEQRNRVKIALEDGAKKLGLWENNTFGDIIEDRGSQVTFSALGQKAPADLKYKWDPTVEKRQKLRDYVASLVPDLEVRVGGSTSIDITMIGVDKAYGMQKLIEKTKVEQDSILFIGDRLQEGGNDYPVKAMGIDTIEVERWEDTALVLEGILGVTQ
ncbi:MAG: HAD-IIB family hydrolase [Candidatus Saccharibacteria bacterium]